jgi:transposase
LFTERTSAGLDVHARSVVASATDTVTGELFEARLSPAHDDVREWLHRLPGPVAAVYEAGPTGFGLSRSLNADGIRCEVAAPSKLQRPPGDRVKTDLRDARHLSRLLQLDQIVPVAVPTVGSEAARDLVRAREDCRRDLTRARHRVTHLLLRHGVIYSQGKPWTLRHQAWLTAQQLGQPATQKALEEGVDRVLGELARRDRLDEQITQLAAESEFTQVVRRLRCLRGIDTLTAFALAVEVGDWGRFTGRSFGAFVGLVPSEDSSGQTRSLGPITRAGNGHLRRLLIEAAWHHRKPYRPTKTMQTRWDQAPPAARARGDKGNRRLHRRWAGFDARSKKPTVANTAIARELAGWCWSLAILE